MGRHGWGGVGVGVLLVTAAGAQFPSLASTPAQTPTPSPTPSSAPQCTAPGLFSNDYIAITQSTGKNAEDLGAYDLCNTVGTYCIMYASNLTFGICVPSACNASDIVNPDTGIMSFLIAQIPALLLLDPYDADFTCGTFVHSQTNGGIVVITTIAVLAGLVVAGTGVDWWHRRRWAAGLTASAAEGAAAAAVMKQAARAMTPLYAPPLVDMDAAAAAAAATTNTGGVGMPGGGPTTSPGIAMTVFNASGGGGNRMGGGGRGGGGGAGVAIVGSINSGGAWYMPPSSLPGGGVGYYAAGAGGGPMPNPGMVVGSPPSSSSAAMPVPLNLHHLPPTSMEGRGWGGGGGSPMAASGSFTPASPIAMNPGQRKHKLRTTLSAQVASSMPGGGASPMGSMPPMPSDRFMPQSPSGVDRMGLGMQADEVGGRGGGRGGGPLFANPPFHASPRVSSAPGPMAEGYGFGESGSETMLLDAGNGDDGGGYPSTYLANPSGGGLTGAGLHPPARGPAGHTHRDTSQVMSQRYGNVHRQGGGGGSGGAGAAAPRPPNTPGAPTASGGVGGPSGAGDGMEGGGGGAGGGDAGMLPPRHGAGGASSEEEDGYDVMEGNPGLAVLKCWSLMHNAPTIVTPSHREPSELSALNGVRTLSMLGIIVGHTVTYMIPIGFVNDEAVLPPNGAFSQWHFQFIPASEFAMDSFLVLSGFLATYALVRQLARTSSHTITLPTYLWYLCHRAIRLLPSYSLVLATYVFLVPQLSSGPFWGMIDTFVGNCNNWWWTNIVFLNNLIPAQNNFQQMCMGWTFYLALDVQFYIFVPAFVALYLFLPALAVGIMTVLSIISIIAASVVTARDNLSVRIDFDTTHDMEYSDQIYTKPWMRVVPYFIGMCLSFAWLHVQQKRAVHRVQRMPQRNLLGIETFVDMHTSNVRSVLPFRTAWWLTVAAEATAVCVLAAVIFGAMGTYTSFDNPWDSATNVAYTVFTRPAWAMAVAAILFVCFTQQNTLMNAILGSSLWQPLARLTFGAFLVHPIVMQVAYFSVTQYFRYTPLMVATWVASHVTVSYAIAVVLYLLAERPLANVEMLVMTRCSTNQCGACCCRRRRTVGSDVGDGAAEGDEGGLPVKLSKGRAVTLSRDERHAPLLEIGSIQ